MNDQEALRYLKDAKRTNDMLCILPKSDIGECLIKALEEIQQYRAIGTVEECRAAVEKKEVRNKAIDDFAELLKGKLVRKYANTSETQQYVAMQATDCCNEIAEQLKGGGVDA